MYSYSAAFLQTFVGFLTKKIPLSPTLWLSQEIRAGSWGDALGVARLFVHLGCDLEFAFTGHLVVPFAQLFFHVAMHDRRQQAKGK